MFSLLNGAQKLAVQIRLAPNQNNTYDISAVDNTQEGNRSMIFFVDSLFYEKDLLDS